MYFHRAIVLENIKNIRARPRVIIWKFRPLGRVGVKGYYICIDSDVMVPEFDKFFDRKYSWAI